MVIGEEKSFVYPLSPGGTDTSDADATASDILDGKTAYVNGEKVTGNIPSKTSSDVSVSDNVVTFPKGNYASGFHVTVGFEKTAQTFTPTTSDQTIAAGNFLTGDQTIKGDANLVSANIADGVTIFGVTGEHQGGGGTKPDYLISDGDTVSTLYFNKDYALASWCALLTGWVTDPDSGLDVVVIGLGYLYVVDLTGGNYALVWNDGVTVTLIWASAPVPAYGVTTAGWQVGYFTPSSSISVDMSDIIQAFQTIMDDVVAKDDIAFGDHGGGNQPQLNAPSVSVNKNTLTITNPSTNGNFVSGYKVLADGTEVGTTSTTTFDLSAVTGNSAAITAKATGTNFIDSAASSSASWTRYLQVSFYDGASQMTGSPVSVAYGSTVAQAITAGNINTIKSGYDFEGWYSNSGLTVAVPTSTSVTSNMILYGKWTESQYMSISEKITKSYNIEVVGYSPDSNYYAYWTNGYLYVYDATTSPYTLVASKSVVANNFFGGRWVSNNKIFAYYKSSSSAHSCSMFTISGANITVATVSAVYTNDRFRNISCNTNSSGKIVISGNTGDSEKRMQIYDTVNGTAASYSRSSASSYAQYPGIPLFITDDDTIIITANRNLRYLNSSTYTGDGTNIYNVSAGEVRHGNFVNNKLIFAANDTSSLEYKGNSIKIYNYSGGAFSLSKSITLDTNKVTNHTLYALINPADNNIIYTYNGNIYAENMSGTSIQSLSLDENIDLTPNDAPFYVGLPACISSDGKKLSIQRTTKEVYIYTIKPMT